MDDDSPSSNGGSDVPEDDPVSPEIPLVSGASSQTVRPTTLDNPGTFLERRSKTDPLIVQPDVVTLLVGDSNVRFFKPVPKYWQVICIPGLCPKQLAALLKKSNIPPSVKHIIASVGINDRDSANVEPLVECLKAGRGPGRTILFPTVVISKHLGLRQSTNLYRLNRTARDLDFVQLIPCHSEIENPLFTDPTGIHYDLCTAKKIFNIIVSHINSLNCI